MHPQEIKLLTCKNVWSKGHKKLTHQLTYKISYENGKIVHASMTVDSPFPISHFEISDDIDYCNSYKCQITRYLGLSTRLTDRIEANCIKYVVVKDADPVEMTVEEIEAELGKKIKIVSKG